MHKAQILILDAKRVFGCKSDLSPNELIYRNDWDYDEIEKYLLIDFRCYQFSQEFERNKSAISAATPVGFRRLLGHYLVCSLEHPDSEVTEVLVSNICSLVLSSNSERLSLLCDEQRELLKRYLHFVCCIDQFMLSQEELESVCSVLVDA